MFASSFFQGGIQLVCSMDSGVPSFFLKPVIDSVIFSGNFHSVNMPILPGLKLKCISMRTVAPNSSQFWQSYTVAGISYQGR